LSGGVVAIQKIATGTADGVSRLLAGGREPDVRSQRSHGGFAERRPNRRLTLTTEVKRKGASGWSKEYRAVPGDVVQWLHRIRNGSSRPFRQVTARTVLAPHLTLIPGSLRLIDASQDRQQSDAPLFGGGLIVGDFPPGGIRYLLFDTRVDATFPGCATRVRLFALVSASGLAEMRPPRPTRESSADVVIGKARC
jgi:hypothetical protein